MYCESKQYKCVVKPFVLSLGKFSETSGFRGMVCAGLSYSSRDIAVSRYPQPELGETGRNMVEW